MAKQNQMSEDMIYNGIRKRISEQEPEPVSEPQKLSKDEAMNEALGVMAQFFVAEGENMQVEGADMQEAQRNILAQVASVGMAYLDEVGVSYTEQDIQDLVNKFAKELENGNQ